MGESFLIVNLINSASGRAEHHSAVSDDKSIQSTAFAFRLRLKLFGGPCTGQVCYYEPEKNDMIRIGRSAAAEIPIDDPVLSNYHATIRYNFDDCVWVLEDGTDGKRSLNGTWLYLNEEFDIYSGLIFKANQTLFQV